MRSCVAWKRFIALFLWFNNIWQISLHWNSLQQRVTLVQWTIGCSGGSRLCSLGPKRKSLEPLTSQDCRRSRSDLQTSVHWIFDEKLTTSFLRRFQWNLARWCRITFRLPGIKVGLNAPERSSGAREFDQERSGPKRAIFLSWPERTFHGPQKPHFSVPPCLFRKSRYVTLISETLCKFDEQQQHEETCRVFRTAYYT